MVNTLTVARKDIRRARHFDADGTPCCIVGHVLAANGITRDSQFNFDDYPDELGFLINYDNYDFSRTWGKISNANDLGKLAEAVAILAQHDISVTITE